METPSKNVQLLEYLAMKLCFIFQFQQVPFAFTLVLGETLISSETSGFDQLWLDRPYFTKVIRVGVLLILKKIRSR